MEIEYLSCEENTGLALADNETVSSSGKDDGTVGDSKKKVLEICLVLEERSRYIPKELVIEGESK